MKKHDDHHRQPYYENCKYYLERNIVYRAC